jgi:hypothetical protein
VQLYVLFLCCLAGASAQTFLNPKDATAVNRVLDSGVKGGRLDCHIEPEKPFLDFAFRYQSGYTVTCPVRLFDERRAEIYDFIRVVPDGGSPVVLGQRSVLAPVPEVASSNLRRLKTQITYSCGFLTGPGGYSVEAVVNDSRNRFVEKHWHFNVVPARDQRFATMLKPGAVAPLTSESWARNNGNSGKGPRITILLHAAPINPRSQRLRAWDCDFLMESVSSVLAALGSGSPRLIAFNLDQQRELVRYDRFTNAEWNDLAESLRHLELGSVPLQVVARRSGWADMVTELVNEEMNTASRSDAVIFIGPHWREDTRISLDLLKAADAAHPRFFDIALYPAALRGREFPDSIGHLTADLGGRVLKIHTPGELAQAIEKIRGELSKSLRKIDTARALPAS